MLNMVLNSPVGEEWKSQDISIFNIKALFFVNLFQIGIKFTKGLPCSN